MFKPNHYTQKQKQKISKELNYVSKEEAIEDFEKLKDIGCNAKNKGLSRVGTDVVNKFTQVERLNTKSKKGLSFFDLLSNKSKITTPAIIKLLKYYNVSKKDADVKIWKRVMDLYFGSISVFKPIIAMELYCRYSPNTILDFTMGWGGRMVGACALNVPNYIGIDNNTNLITPYKHLKNLMDDLSKTNTKLYFEDAVNFNYNKIEYDMVFTSPPYYNIEIYNNIQKQSKDDWDQNFYIPLFTKTYKGLKKGGYYCLNIPVELYERVMLSLLGKYTEKILLKKIKRFSNSEYHEYIYIWKK